MNRTHLTKLHCIFRIDQALVREQFDFVRIRIWNESIDLGAEDRLVHLDTVSPFGHGLWHTHPILFHYQFFVLFVEFAAYSVVCVCVCEPCAISFFFCFVSRTPVWLSPYRIFVEWFAQNFFSLLFSSTVCRFVRIDLDELGAICALMNVQIVNCVFNYNVGPDECSVFIHETKQKKNWYQCATSLSNPFHSKMMTSFGFAKFGAIQSFEWLAPRQTIPKINIHLTVVSLSLYIHAPCHMPSAMSTARMWLCERTENCLT